MILPESPLRRIQRWIGEQDPSTRVSAATAIPSVVCDSDEDCARTQHDLNWELKAFEREMALRFVMNRELDLGFEPRETRTWHPKTPNATQPPATPTANFRRRPLKPWLRSASSTSTLQPFNPPPVLPSFQFPPSLHLAPPAPDPPTSSTVRPSVFGLLRPPSPTHKPSPSVLSLTSHFSSCTSSASHEEAPPSVLPSCDVPSARPLVAHIGRKITHGLLAPTKSSPAPSISPSSLRSRNFDPTSPSRFSSRTFASPSLVNPGTSSPSPSLHSSPLPSLPPSHELASTTPSLSLSTSSRDFRKVPSSPHSPPASKQDLGTGTKSRRRVSVPDMLAPKKRRLIVRGVAADDEYAVEGLRRWARTLGEVSRICRAKDGAIWIEFRDRRVAESVCCLQAQVQIPHVGRVILGWAEGRQIG